MTAQESGTIKGQITAEEGQAVPMIYIYEPNTSRFAESDMNGRFELELPVGEREFIASGLGYLEMNKKVTVTANQVSELNFELVEDPEMVLDDVNNVSKSLLRQLQESSFNVVGLDAEALHNTTLDVSQALERVSGVRVRRSGGVGSDYNIMLDGFTGNHVKYFMDGLPMEGFSSAFQLNNIPINLAKRIEVYKGVVPIDFGSDALGGAINIVTDSGKQNFVDASYSFGSFNTHKSFLNAAYTSESGFTARLTAFQNYSDNDYKVKVDIKDLETEKFTGDIRRVKRFHDMHRNYTLMGKIGVVNKSYADQLLLGFIYGDEYNEIQHPAYMKIAFGQKYETSKTLMPSLIYRKKDLFTPKLDVSLTANYNFGKATNIDDSNRSYNWLGEYKEKDAPGEFQYSRNFYKNRNSSVNTNVSYAIKEKHAITLNSVRL